jgi:uncharacterized protein YndB with AHSA1/START domain
MAPVSTATANDLTLNISQEIRVNAPIDATFAALLEELGPAHEGHDGRALPMKLELRPGGRWYRDLGEDNGHLWGHVQAVKHPTLIEITGPLFMSFAVVSNVQYRLSTVEGGTLISFRHTALGFFPDEYRAGLDTGWRYTLDRVRTRASGRVQERA